ncbi:hypothetical protein BFW38_13110 [Terasakiispira papahanaumokuakeensis]|uniref:EamA domain-containing protein n=1 Tax=Terasakiispira papahanaumokuakeensis TaxID=197479 RepID=A0A1E2VBD9_9GAMM|nr:DMT family transporter [Terasakiispira papahanaumokuakeensis]ODC04330.1 hypothetical protein BFW38_13110 [Terasakiispira papahanaumokuakeensis]
MRDEPLRASGIALRLAATGLFALMSLCVQQASHEVGTGQIVFWRSALALIPILAYLGLTGALPQALKTRNPKGHAIRSLLGCSAMFLSFIAIAYLPLSLAAALGFLAPILSVMLASLLIREVPSMLTWAMTLLSFMGVLLVINPFNDTALSHQAWIGIICGIAMAALTALAKIMIRTLTAHEHSGAIAFYFAVTCSLIGLATAIEGWTLPTGATWGWLIGAGLCGGLAHIAMTEALARAPVATLAVFEYTAIFWALGFDLWLFERTPSVGAIVGVICITISSLVIALKGRAPVAPAQKSMTESLPNTRIIPDKD